MYLSQLKFLLLNHLLCQVIDFQVIETPPSKKNETHATSLLILTEEELIAIDLLDPRSVNSVN